MLSRSPYCPFHLAKHRTAVSFPFPSGNERWSGGVRWRIVGAQTMARPQKRKPPRAPLDSTDWETVELLYLNSPSTLTMRELATMIHVSPQTLMSRASRGGWAAKKAGAKAALPDASKLQQDAPLPGTPVNRGENDTGNPGDITLVLPPETCTHEVACKKPRKRRFSAELGEAEIDERAELVISKRADQYQKEMGAQASRLPQIMAKMDADELLRRSGDIDKLDKVNRRNLGLERADSNGRAPLVQIALLSDARPVRAVPKGKTTLATE